jgi:hypothetical protein
MKDSQLIKKIIFLVVFCFLVVFSATDLTEASSVQNHETIEFKGVEDEKAVLKPDKEGASSNNQGNDTNEQGSSSTGFLPKTNEHRGALVSLLGVLCLIIVLSRLRKRAGDKE